MSFPFPCSHKSIIAYLEAHQFPEAAAALRLEADLDEDVLDAHTTKKYESLLEKKWTSVVRLQKKVRARAHVFYVFICVICVYVYMCICVYVYMCIRVYVYT